MRKNLSIFVLLLASISSCQAAPPSTESIDALLTLTKAEALLDSLYGNMEQTMRQAMSQATAGQRLSLEQRRYLDEVPRQFVIAMQDELSWARLKPVHLQIYQDSFTQEEIDGLISFYQGPVGIAFVTKMPAVMQKSMASMQSRLQPMMEKMKVAMDQALENAKVSK